METTSDCLEHTMLFIMETPRWWPGTYNAIHYGNSQVMTKNIQCCSLWKLPGDDLEHTMLFIMELPAYDLEHTMLFIMEMSRWWPGTYNAIHYGNFQVMTRNIQCYSLWNSKVIACNIQCCLLWKLPGDCPEHTMLFIMETPRLLPRIYNDIHYGNSQVMA